MTCSLWAGRNPVNDKRVVCIEQPCSHGALPNQSHPALNGTEWKCVCHGGGDSLCISKTAKGFYVKCKLQPESYKSMTLLRTSDGGGVIKANQSKGAGVRGHISEHLQSAARPPSQVGDASLRNEEEGWRKTTQKSKCGLTACFDKTIFCHPTVPVCSQRSNSVENELKISVYSCWCCSKPVWILKNIDRYKWGQKVFSQPLIVQVLLLRIMSNFHRRYTSTMRDKMRRTKKSRKSHCRIFLRIYGGKLVFGHPQTSKISGSHRPVTSSLKG